METKYIDDIKKRIVKYNENIVDNEDITSLTDLYIETAKEGNELSKILEMYNELYSLIRDKITDLRQKYDTKSEEREDEKEEEPVEKKKTKRLTKKELAASKEESKEEVLDEIEKEEEPKNKTILKKEPVESVKKPKGRKKKGEE